MWKVLSLLGWALAGAPAEAQQYCPRVLLQATLQGSTMGPERALILPAEAQIHVQGTKLAFHAARNGRPWQIKAHQDPRAFEVFRPARGGSIEFERGVLEGVAGNVRVKIPDMVDPRWNWDFEMTVQPPQTGLYPWLPLLDRDMLTNRLVNCVQDHLHIAIWNGTLEMRGSDWKAFKIPKVNSDRTEEVLWTSLGEGTRVSVWSGKDALDYALPSGAVLFNGSSPCSFPKMAQVFRFRFLPAGKPLAEDVFFFVRNQAVISVRLATGAAVGP